MLTVVQQALAGRNGVPPPDQAAILQEKWEQGDFASVTQMLKDQVRQEFAPQLDNLAMRNAIEIAETVRPELRDHQTEVEAVLRENPVLVRYAAMNNRELAPFILAGATANVLVPKLQGEIAQLKATIPDLVKKGIAEYQAKLKGLPTSTSKAGTTEGQRPAPQKSGKDIMREEFESSEHRLAG